MSPELAIECLRKIAREQDQAAFSEVFGHYAPRIKAYMMRHGADAATAEEVAQEALTTVWRKAHMFAPEKGNPTTWIFTIARNMRIDSIRKERVFQPLPEEHVEQVSEDGLPDDMAIQKELSEALHAALMSLPADQSEVIKLSYMDGLSHGEVASKLNVPLGTIKSRMRLAYEKLRPLLKDLR